MGAGGRGRLSDGDADAIRSFACACFPSTLCQRRAAMSKYRAEGVKREKVRERGEEEGEGEGKERRKKGESKPIASLVRPFSTSLLRFKAVTA